MRINFDLDAAMAALPAHFPAKAPRSERGSAGVRLRGHLRADLPDTLLREMAGSVLGAQRCSEAYLEALKVVLGNQAHAERRGYVLEMNLRVSFASPRTMRTIIDQMEEAGISFTQRCSLGEGRIQSVRCFAGIRDDHADPAAALEALYRSVEGELPYPLLTTFVGLGDVSH